MKRPLRLRAVCSMTKCPSRKIAWLLRQQRRIPIQMVPPHLDHAHLLIREIVHDVIKDVPRRNEIRIEYHDELARRLRQSLGQCPRFVSFAVFAVDILDRITLGDPLVARFAGNPARIVRAVVQHLNFKFLQRIVDLRRSRR